MLQDEVVDLRHQEAGRELHPALPRVGYDNDLSTADCLLEDAEDVLLDAGDVSGEGVEDLQHLLFIVWVQQARTQ